MQRSLVAMLSIRAYARHRAGLGLSGTTHKAVQKAIATGRIQVAADGLIDSDAADRAWAANSSEGHRRNPAHAPPVPLDEPPTAPPARSSRGAAPPASSPVAAAGGAGVSFQQASAIEKAYKAKLAKLEYEERIGELVPAAAVETRLVNVFSQCRTKLMGVPSRARQRDPTLSPAQIALVEELVREALEDLAAEAAERAAR